MARGKGKLMFNVRDEGKKAQFWIQLVMMVAKNCELLHSPKEFQWHMYYLHFAMILKQYVIQKVCNRSRKKIPVLEDLQPILEHCLNSRSS